MSSSKTLIAAIAAATFSLAFAQGTPPRPATDPAVGAGQRSTENTPMGTTGTPGTAGAQGSTSASGAGAASAGTAATTAPMDAGSTTRATPGSTAMDTDVHAAPKKHKKHKKVKKVDRN